MLRACSRARPRVSRRKSNLEDLGHGRHQAASATVFASAASATAPRSTAPLRVYSVRAGSSLTNADTNSRNRSSGGSDNRQGNRSWWEACSAGEEDASSIAGTVLAAAALAGLCGVVGSNDRRMLQEPGPVPGGPIFGEGDEDDSFQRFPSSNRVHHAIKVQ